MQNNKSLNAIYSNNRPEGMKVLKGFLIPKGLVYIEEGFNIRDIDDEHVQNFVTSYTNGSPVPALVVEATDRGFKVIEGHHRKIAADMVDSLTHLECKDYSGASEQSTLVFMVASSQAKNLKPLERAKAYQRMIALGMTEKDIQTQLGRSRKDVKNHLMLLGAPEQIVHAIEDGRIGYAAAVEELSRNRETGEQNIVEALEEAAQTGEKVTRATLKERSTFTKKDHTSVMEILSGMSRKGWPAELKELVDKYLNK